MTRICLTFSTIIKSQCYERKFSIKYTNSRFNSMTVHNFNLDWTISWLWYKLLWYTVSKLTVNWLFFVDKFHLIGLPPEVGNSVTTASKREWWLNQYLNCLCKTRTEEEKCKWNVAFVMMPCSNNPDRWRHNMKLRVEKIGHSVGRCKCLSKE